MRYDTDLDHHSAQFREHNYEALNDLRDRCPVAKSSAWDGFWIFSSYDAVFEASRDPGLFSSHMDKAVPTLGQPDPMIPIDIDPPLLQQYRRVLLPFLSPKAAADREVDLRQMVGAMIDGFIERGAADLSQELFTPLPAKWILRFLGLQVPGTRAVRRARARGLRARRPGQRRHAFGYGSPRSGGPGASGRAGLPGAGPGRRMTTALRVGFVGAGTAPPSWRPGEWPDPVLSDRS
jgi:cytochrome P450